MGSGTLAPWFCPSPRPSPRKREEGVLPYPVIPDAVQRAVVHR